VLDQNPLCVECQREQRVRVATVVDHIVPHRGDLERFYDVTNLQGLCAMHHSAKTGRGE
jgi:5-methylcytosine-specific restriction protein A